MSGEALKKLKMFLDKHKALIEKTSYLIKQSVEYPLLVLDTISIISNLH